MEAGYRDHMRTIELDAPLSTIVIGEIVRGDANADRLVLTLKNLGQSAELSGYSADGIFINRLGMEVPIKAQINANVVTAVLGKGCYDVGGTAVGHVRLISSDASQIRTVVRFVADVTRDGNGVGYDPDSVIGDLTTLLAKLTAMENATKDGLAAAQEARNAAAEAVQIAEAAGTQAVSLAQAAGVQAIENANAAGAEAKATAETAAAKADAAREAIEGDLGAIKAALQTKAPAIECEASGSILTIPDAAAQPAVQLISHIVPVQEGSGDPSPENVRPISGWSAVKVRRTGKNLIDVNYNNTAGGINVVVADGLVTINGEITSTSSTNMTLASNVKLKAGTYSLSSRMIGGSVSGWANGSTMFRIYKGTGNTVLASTKYNESDVDEFTLSEDTDIRLTFLRASYSVTYNNLQFAIQLECGSEATEFEPPNIQTLTADLPQTVYGGTLDWKTGVLTVEPFDLATFDGSEDFQIPDSHTNTHTQVFSCTDKKVTNKKAYLLARSDSKSNMFRPIIQSDYTGLRENTFYWADATGAWRFGWGAPGATVDEFKAFLHVTPLQILVPTTAGSKEYQLTPQQLDMLKGLNNVWSDCGDTSLVYVADTKMYIDGKISELVTLALAKN